jgi:hypothetical protein
MARKDSRFLRTPPYAFEIGAVAAAISIWKLLTRAERDEEERPGQAGKEAMPPNRRQA